MAEESIHAMLTAIPGLTFAHVADFFHQRATPRDKQIAEMVETTDDREVDWAITSEGDMNGSWVLAWTWVPFDGTPLDKEAELEDTDAKHHTSAGM